MSKLTSQAQFLREYNDTHREQFNQALFNRDEDVIIEELKKVILSCERHKYFTLKVKRFTVVEDWATIIKLLREQEAIKTDSKDKSINKYDYININDSDIKLLVVDWYMKVKNPKPHTPAEKEMRVLIMVPRYVDKYYFKLFGNYYSAKIQIVDGSTYNNSQSKSKYHNVTLKTLFMATRIYRYKIDLKCTDGTVLQGVYYTSRIFSKLVPVMKYLLAAYGLLGTMEALITPFISLSDVDPEDPNFYVMKRHNVYIIVPKYLFDNDIVTQSLVYTIYISINSKSYSVDDVRTTDFWLRSLGESYNNKSVEKGLSVLDSLESIYDIPTKQALRLPEENKKDIYRVLIWIIREFAKLRIKDNLDLGTKRIRVEDYIASLYAMKLSNGMYSLSEDGENVQISDIERRLYIFPDYLIKAMTRDSLINSRNNVNDIDDAFTALKYTYKGLSGLGESKQSSIPQGYRHIHMSHLGRVDLDSSPANDPGLSGMLCPMAPIYDRYFADFEEPNNWREDVKELLENYRKLRGLKSVCEFQRSIDIPISGYKEEALDESIQYTENVLIPYLMNVEDSMVTVSLVKPFEIVPDGLSEFDYEGEEFDDESFPTSY